MHYSMAKYGWKYRLRMQQLYYANSARIMDSDTVVRGRMTTIKKLYYVILIAAIVNMVVFSGFAVADNIGFGPAPNSGDCVSDGSGFDRTDWPNDGSPATGPAPNSGDGIPDGSGFE